jgi:Uma2 family endonuclease
MATTTAPAAYSRPSYPGASPLREVYLPESDGKPMAETDDHRDIMMDVLDTLEEQFRADEKVYVSGNIFVYYRDDTGEMQSVSPDILVVRGVQKKKRRIYNIEVEGKAPDLVIELTSLSTKKEDLGNKRFVYANLGVKEYFIFDPFGDTIRPALRGFRLESGDYLPIVGTRLKSEVLGLELRLEDGRLRLYDFKNDQRLLTRAESHAARRAAEAKARAAEAEAKAAKAQAMAAETKAIAAETKAVATEAENVRLREELEKLQRKQS